jgi:iron complex outermembrane recepter protein
MPSSRAFAAANPTEEIHVHSERRPSPLATLPASVTRLSGADLEASAIDGTLELPLRDPSLVMSTTTAFGLPYLRGIGSDLFSIGAESSVAIFVDDVYEARPVSAVQDLYDIRAVEILRGPQGALFGRNTTGGVIHVLTQDPQPELGAKMNVLYGSFNDVRMDGELNVPLTERYSQLRIAGEYNRRDGLMRNLFTGKRVDDRDRRSIRSKLRIAPTDSLTIILSGDYSHERSSRNLVGKLGEPLAGSPAFLAGGSVPSEPRNVLLDHTPAAKIDLWGASARARWDLETASISSLTAFRSTYLNESIDVDSTDLPFITNDPEESAHTFSQELHVSAKPDAPVQWMTGVEYFQEDSDQQILAAAPLIPLIERTISSLETRSFAAFGDARVPITERLHAGAGLRYDIERKSWDLLQRINGMPVAQLANRRAWQAWSPRAWVEYQFDSGLFGYAKLSRGYRSGGFNSTTPQVDPFGPESLWAYEAGLRAAFAPLHANAHLSGFYYDYSDIQLQVITPGSAIPIPLVVNAAAARLWGFELDGSYSPLKWLSFDASLAWLHAGFSDLEAVDPNDPNPNQDTTQSGNRLPRAPVFSSYVAAQAATTGLSIGTLSLRAEYRFRSRIFFNVFEDRFASQSAAHFVNARIAFEPSHSHWMMALVGTNLTNSLTAQNKIRLDGQSGNVQFWSEPRSISIRASLEF